MNEPLSFYLNLTYPYTVIPEEGGEVFVSFPDLPGCMTQVERVEDIGPMAEEIRRLWLESAWENGVAIPPPSGNADYSGKFLVRLPKSLHRRLAEGAEREGVSLNAWVTTLLARNEALAAPADQPREALTGWHADEHTASDEAGRQRASSRMERQQVA
ncbi:MAG: toxin-antitoxin system HicB family antitoxin [Chloroflexota bacterium]